MTWQAWLVVTVVVLVALFRYGWHRRRYPDKGGPRCGGAGRLRTRRPLIGGVVSGLCPRCAGSPWSPRRI